MKIGLPVLVLGFLCAACGAYGTASADSSPTQFLTPDKGLPPVKKSQLVCLKEIYSKYQMLEKKQADSKLPKSLLTKLFKCFPDNWNEFYGLFGFSWKENYSGPLADEESSDLIAIIFPMTREVVGQVRYEKRLISLIMDAKLPSYASGTADANAFLFGDAYNEIDDHPKSMLSLLNTYKHDELMKFWFWTLIWQDYKGLESEVCGSGHGSGTRACRTMRLIIKRYPDYLTPC